MHTPRMQFVLNEADPRGDDESMKLDRQLQANLDRARATIAAARAAAERHQAEANRLTAELETRRKAAARAEARAELGRIDDDELSAAKRALAETARDHQNAMHGAEVEALKADELEADLTRALEGGLFERVQELKREVPTAVDLLIEGLAKVRKASMHLDAIGNEATNLWHGSGRMFPGGYVSVPRTGLWKDLGTPSRDYLWNTTHAPVTHLVRCLAEDGYEKLLKRHGLPVEAQ